MSTATVCLTFDFDAVSLWLHPDPARRSPANYSRGRFGAEVAAPRLLDLLAELGVSTTWFIPGHTIDSFPSVCADVVDDGHEVGHHGWSHTRPSDYPSRRAERRDVARATAAIEDLTGAEPRGYRSPSWDHSPHTLDILLEAGFDWDSSLMARDFTPTFVRRDESAPLDGPYDPGEPTDLLELPVSWQRDDFPPLGYTGGGWVADEAAVFTAWRRQFDWMVDNVDAGVFVLTFHPQVIGQAHRLGRLHDLIAHMQDRPGVRFRTMSAAAVAARDRHS